MIRIALALVVAVVAVGVGLLQLDSATAQTSPSATRSFAPSPVAPGGEVTITITAEGHGNFGDVAETLPAGFTLFIQQSARGRSGYERRPDGHLGPARGNQPDHLYVHRYGFQYGR